MLNVNNQIICIYTNFVMVGACSIHNIMPRNPEKRVFSLINLSYSLI